ncbi:2Fe-2S iron-sulfur cluster binding domain-containing protein [Burkholderia sp. R-69980]|nr:2Fe-2S iron-sulfur cluster binding domain-containing protein [Burkholderia sp. R-69980]MCI0152028.1 2Fe-2S iron-sulfur cluster binding domain-containing protein [Paraburkholderia sediminicola]
MLSIFKTRQDTFKVDVSGLEQDVQVDSEETLLSALLRQQVAVSHLCQVGECGSCRCKLIAGRVKLKRDVSARLSDEDLRRGHILACQAVALGDVEIHVPGIGNGLPEQASAPAIEARIESMQRLAHNVIELTLRPDTPIHFYAGQFATMHCLDERELAGVSRCYSFADAPVEAAALIRFHIRHVPGGRFTDWLFAADRIGASLAISGVAGSFGYRASGRPVVCIAGGTGLAPILSILRSLAMAATMPDVTLMLAARTAEDLYGIADLEQLMPRWAGRFSLLPVLSLEPEHSHWGGLRGFCTDHFDRLGPLADNDFYVCGPPGMIDAVANRLRNQVPEAQLHVDRFLDQSSPR